MAQNSMYIPPGNPPVIHARQRAPSTPRPYGVRDNRPLMVDFEQPRPHYPGTPTSMDNYGHMMNQSMGRMSYPPVGHSMPPVPVYSEWNHPVHEPLRQDVGPPNTPESPTYIVERAIRRGPDSNRGSSQYISQRRTSIRGDEFDGPHQILDPPSSRSVPTREEELPQLPTNLDAAEQDKILHEVNDRLSLSAYEFFARYQFPIPLETDKRPVQVPSDREWNEWVHLLKRLATRRRIPRHTLHNGQIKQLITVLENSLEMRHAAKHSSRPVKDDRNVLQLISAGTQVAKILKDSSAMQFFDRLYVDTEKMINDRRRRVRFATP
ncbi:hypothetical protein N7520_005038 [Penicillium odoratum]|uniref:uncharacterized protein n=1 Tax=Penicillium odoratum TaxID=1167516 RepID=UPI002547B8DF|nr:uncharacterized protein N7520_005038 [Penicillium odoratum]KAJ5765479.1 hypothetical protein N7520_005038 [Penicillium odoratum]